MSERSASTEPAGGHVACDLLDAELALDRLEAELASELPSHVRAFAAAYADHRSEPAAPAAARRPGALVVARRALVHPELTDRALALLRLVAPVAIDDDPAVAAVLRGYRDRSTRTWDALAALAAARDTAARARFGRGYVELVHALHGADTIANLGNQADALDPSLPPAIAGWDAPDASARIDVRARWQALADAHGARGRIDIVERRDARPRAFIVEPGREVIVVVPPRAETPAQRFAIVHELGHAIAALLVDQSASALRAGLPRVVDEAVAAYVARLDEPADADSLARRARVRRRTLAVALDRIECANGRERPTPRPPWALWHDMGAQAAYVSAEDLAAKWWDELGPAPPTGALARAIRHATLETDRATTLR